MKFHVTIMAADGSPLAAGELSLVEPSGLGLPSVRAKILDGEASFAATPGPIWGLLVDGWPVLAVAIHAQAESVELGELRLVPEGVPWPAFHAKGGRLYGFPSAGLSALRPPVAVTPPLSRDPAPDAAAIIGTPVGGEVGADPGSIVSKAGMTFADALGSTARQLGEASLQTTAFTLTGASVKLKGIPTSQDQALGIDFPSVDLAKSAVGLSELSFSLRPNVTAAAATPPPVPTGPRVIDVLGYSRELGLRKLTAAGYTPEVVSEVVRTPENVGRIVRQFPAAGTVLAAGAVVRVFLGKGEGDT